MTQLPSNAVVLASEAAKPASRNVKRTAKIASAAALSFGLMSAFAMPAYATAPEVEGQPDAVAAMQQSLETTDVEDAMLPLAAPDAEVSAEVREERARKKAEAEAEAEAERLAAEQSEQQESQKSSDFSGKDVPAGKGAEGLVDAALAQVGVSQDCTDLVQNSLAAIGMTTRRDAGGYDHGVSDFMQYGTEVTDGNYAPGDILIWPNAPHTAIYIGNGQAVHGGWGGNQTVVNTYASPSATPIVIRLNK